MHKISQNAQISRDSPREEPQKKRTSRVIFRYRRDPLTSEEVSALTSACQTAKERLVVFTLLDTGLRLAEFCSLTREAVDWQAHRVTVVGKGGKKRVVPLTPRVRALLEAYFALEDRLRMSRRTVQEIIRRVARRAGIMKKVTPHILRHTFAVMALRRGISLPSLQRLLGHEHLVTTALYLNTSNEEAIREFLEKW
jgi:integrase/recombinase XerD